MIDPKVESAIEAALTAFSKYSSFDATPFTSVIDEVFGSEKDFMSKVAMLDEVFDDYPQLEVLREVFFDLLLVNFFSADVKKLEEDYLFPRFEKANKLTELVKTLKAQHQAGRKVTDIVIRRANARDLKDMAERAKVAEAIRQFNRMYAPHEAREDTVLFPAFRSLVSANEYDSLGEDFEKKENELFGDDGFEKMVDKVAGIEKKLGIYDLAQFTPKT